MSAQQHALLPDADEIPPGDAPALHSLCEMIEHAAHLLPAQGPITSFVHHNTLHAFEDLHFDEGVVRGARVFGCHPYLPEAKFREFLETDRIQAGDLRAVLLDDLGDHADGLIGRLGTRYYLRLAMLQHPISHAPSAELRWLVAETEALRRFRGEAPAAVKKQMIDETRHWVMRDLRNGGNGAAQDDLLRQHVAELCNRFGRASIEQWSDSIWETVCLQLLWRVCREKVAGIGAFAPSSPALVRHRDWLLAATGQDSDQLVNEPLIRLCAAFLDQGFADWSMPHRREGFLGAFWALYERPAAPNRWQRGLAAEARRIAQEGLSAAECIEESLRLLGVEESERERFISETLLALRGWAGMIWQMETRGDRVVNPAPPGSLVEYLAVRLVLERFAMAYVARETLDFHGPLADLRACAAAHTPTREPVNIDQRAFVVFQLAQVLGWKPRDLYHLAAEEWSALVREIEEFSSLERRRVFQQAYERRYRIQTLDAAVVHRRRAAPINEQPSYQVICCIDEREESFRRHLEEVAPDSETLGAVGFYAVAMYYRGAADAHFAPLCPAIIQPQHYVCEEVVYTFEGEHKRRAKTRRVLGSASHRMHVGSRTFAFGAFLTALLGPLASIPLVVRILFPRTTAQLRRLAGRFVQAPSVTQLKLERSAPDPSPDNGGVGYTVAEMAGIVERLLRDVGLTKRFAPLVVVTGHGSSSLNNPHESAHDCGACGGARGGPNARAFSQMANDPRVRALVAQNGLQLPDNVYFVGAYHNTCDDSVVYFDLDRLPATHRELFEKARIEIDEARRRSAHERCRRFESAPLQLSTEAALRHVEGRAEDLAQTRPEYGHATNALCFVGRRRYNRGLFLDRRAFLTSYDPTQDNADCAILARILAAVIPVCAGISLEYYFSFVDSTGYGCGTKLPHNVTSLLGVMDGAASDLRTGLPWQMVEIHEPVRLLFVIETTPQNMQKIMDGSETIGSLCRNDWVQIATQDPATGEIHVLRRGRFELYEPESSNLPTAKSSINWYRGWRDHLGFASIDDRLAKIGDVAPSSAGEKRDA